MLVFPVSYTDRLGELKTLCYSDGSKLELELRGVALSGSSFNLLAPVNGVQEDMPLEIDKWGCLSECCFQVQIPIVVQCADTPQLAVLEVVFDYRTGEGRKGNDLKASLQLEAKRYHTERVHDSMEYLLAELQKQLPESYHIQSCMTCRYSNYHPVGNNDFGALACFRAVKERVGEISDKQSLFTVWDEAIEQNKLLNVQETFLCSEFAVLRKTDWCYKSWDFDYS